MKALLIMPYNRDLIHAVSLPLGLLSISTYLNANGHEARICDLSVSHSNVAKVCEEFKPDIVGISLCSVKHLDGAMHISKKLHRLGLTVVWGGPFCDMGDSGMMVESGHADYVSLSEGEGTWLEIMQRLEAGQSLDGCPGLVYMKDGKSVRAPDREFLDLTTLPDLDFSLVDVPAYRQYLYGCDNLVYVYLSKGCPAKCTFCANTVSHRCRYRRRSLDQFMREAEVLVKQYGVNGMYFSDELCFFNKQQLYEVCDAFDASGLDFHWGFQTRIGLLGPEEFRRVYQSGCRWVDFGVESGSEEQLRIMKKAIPYDKIEPTFRWCEDAGLISLANFIIGLPHETEEQFRETVDLALRIHSTQNSLLRFCIPPNTEMGKAAIRDGLMKHQFKKLSDYRRIDFFVSRTDNYSEIPNRELNVVQSYFLWKAIFKKEYGKKEETKKFDLLFKHIQTVFRRLSFLDLRCRILTLTELVLLFLRFFFDVYFHPRTRKKYGLL
ncbi:MAG: B12-binding domain-containing radical SAM protein [Clostridiales bacterium]|nr:B12-binding domain-containing radical SAM protein [Clostridiales bacterium]